MKKKLNIKTNKNKEINIFKILVIILVIIIVYILMMFSDYSRVANGGKPLICVSEKKYEDGGSKEYYCLGYKLIKYNAIQGRKDLVIGSIFMKFENNTDDKSLLDKEENKNFIDIRGQIESIGISDSGKFQIIVKGELYADTLYDYAIIKLEDTTIIEDSNGKIEAKSLKKGDNVEVTFDGIPLDSYPTKGTALKVKKQ